MKTPFERPLGRFADAAFFAGALPFILAVTVGGSGDFQPLPAPDATLTVLWGGAFVAVIALWFTAFAAWARQSPRPAVAIVLALIVNPFVCFKGFVLGLGVGESEPWEHSGLAQLIWTFGEALVFVSFLPALFRVRRLHTAPEPGAWLDASFVTAAWAALVAMVGVALLPGARLGVLAWSLPALGALGYALYGLREACRWLGRVRAGAEPGVAWVAGHARESTVRFEGGTPYRPEGCTLTLNVSAEFSRALREQWRRSWGALAWPALGGIALVGLVRAAAWELPPREISFAYRHMQPTRVTSEAVAGVELWHIAGPNTLVGYDHDAMRTVEGIELLRRVRGVTPRALTGAEPVFREGRCELTDEPEVPRVTAGELVFHCTDGTRHAFALDARGR